jgi:hypothetical protein
MNSKESIDTTSKEDNEGGVSLEENQFSADKEHPSSSNILDLMSASERMKFPLIFQNIVGVLKESTKAIILGLAAIIDFVVIVLKDRPPQGDQKEKRPPETTSEYVSVQPPPERGHLALNL